jgi:hypothetical protein|tara:strand:- start:901 stop:1338 length:438 start_codon:yes stop_codon:yes gene_type:complete
MKNILLMIGFIISITCLAQNNTPDSTNYLAKEMMSNNPEKFTEIQMGRLIYVDSEYSTVLDGELLLVKSRISIIFDIIKKEVYVKINNEERKTYPLPTNSRQKIGFGESFVKQSGDKTYIELTVHNDNLELFNIFKILLPEIRNI